MFIFRIGEQRLFFWQHVLNTASPEPQENNIQGCAVLTGFPARQTLNQVPECSGLFRCLPRARVREGREMLGCLWEEHRALPWAEALPTQFPSTPVLGLWIPQTSDSGHPSGSGVESRRTQACGECSLLEVSLTSLWRYVGWAGISSRGSGCGGAAPAWSHHSHSRCMCLQLSSSLTLA